MACQCSCALFSVPKGTKNCCSKVSQRRVRIFLVQEATLCRLIVPPELTIRAKGPGLVQANQKVVRERGFHLSCEL